LCTCWQVEKELHGIKLIIKGRKSNTIRDDDGNDDGDLDFIFNEKKGFRAD